VKQSTRTRLLNAAGFVACSTIPLLWMLNWYQEGNLSGVLLNFLGLVVLIAMAIHFDIKSR